MRAGGREWMRRGRMSYWGGEPMRFSSERGKVEGVRVGMKG
jgi:hypothetical protein